MNQTESYSRLQRIWHGMRNRCLNTEAVNYQYYGGRGISIEPEWNSFEEFYKWAISSSYDNSLWLDRINNNGNYGPNNCRWSTPKESANNRSTTTSVVAWGERKSLFDWTQDDRCKVDYATLKRRLFQGWLPERALTLSVQKKSKKCKPVLITLWGETKTLAAWSRDKRCKVGYKTLHRRLNVLRWTPEKAVTA